MKLTTPEVNKIAKLYNLGKPKTFNLIKGGLINYNHKLVTDKSTFILRVLGHKVDKWKQDKLKLEFKVLKYLEKKKFPYKVPIPIKNSSSNYLLTINNKTLWVYEILLGKKQKILNPHQFKELAQALATYHNYIKPLKIKQKFQEKNLNGMLKEYEEMKKVKPKNRIDRLALENADFFKSLVEKSYNLKFNTDKLIIHADFSNSNVLFEGDKLIGIYDFDNLELSAKIKDVASAIKRTRYISWNYHKKKKTEFIKHYKKFNHLTKAEEKQIPQAIIKDNCGIFKWFYWGLKKNKRIRYYAMLALVKETKKLVKEVGW